MSKLNIDNWKTFSISEIFQTEQLGKNIQVPTGAMVSKRFLKDGSTPRVTVSNFNNGITGYYSDIDDKNYRIYENFISVSFLGTVFYQKNKASLDMKVHCLKPISDELNLYIATFIVNVVRKAISNFAYQDQLSSTVLPLLTIKLPVRYGKPDWEYMESYMKNIMQESEQNIENLQNINEHKNKIDVKNWQEFLLGGDDGLFNIVKGTRLTKANMKEGNINFIGSSAINNGVTNHISNSERVHPANLITVSYNGSIGEAFYQDEPFWASDDVNVFYPKFEQNFEIAMFLIPLIRKVGEKYKFVDKWKIEDMCNEKIKLPKNENGEPDWEFMENYMKNIMQDTQSKLDKLVCY